MKKVYISMMVFVGNAMASYANTSSSMPWDTTLQKVVNALGGPTARIIGIASIIILGAGFLISEGGTDKKKVFTILVGLSILFNAAWIVTTLFGGGVMR